MNMKQNVRVLVIGPLPWNGGGIEKHICEIFTYLHNDKQIDIVLLCPKNDNGQRIDKGNLKVLQYHRMRSFPYLPLIGKKEVLNAIKEADLIHIHGSGNIDSFIFAILTKNAPLIVTPHFHPKGSSFWLAILKVIYDRLFLRCTLKRSKKIICVSDIEKNEIIKKFGGDIGGKISVIPNGVSVGCIPNPDVCCWRGDTILFVGRLELHKNVNILINTMIYLPKSYTLTIIGEGTQRERLETLTHDLGLTNRVNFLGNVSEQEKWTHLIQCSVLVNFSSIEAFGITVIEGLACSKPILVNNKLGLLELSEKFPRSITAIDVETQNYYQIATIIRQLSGKITKEHLDDYLWKNIALKTLKLYYEVL